MTSRNPIFAILKATESTQLGSEIPPLPRLLFSDDIARITGLSVATIRHYTGNAEQFGHMLPRWFKLPGARRLVWLPDVVTEWILLAQSTAQNPKRRRGRPTKAEQVALKNREPIPEVENQSAAGTLELKPENTGGADHANG